MGLACFKFHSENGMPPLPEMDSEGKIENSWNS